MAYSILYGKATFYNHIVKRVDKALVFGETKYRNTLCKYKVSVIACILHSQSHKLKNMSSLDNRKMIHEMSEDLEVEKSGYFYVLTIHLGFSNLKNQVCESESSPQIVFITM